MTYWYFNNNKHRPDIDEPKPRPIKFKVLFPSWVHWKYFLIDYGIDKKWIEKKDFRQLQDLIGNSLLRYKTDVKNWGHISREFRRLKEIELREQSIYNIDISKIGDSESSSEQTLYTVDRTSAGEVTSNFIDNRVKVDQKNKRASIELLDAMKKQAEMVSPNYKFIKNLANNITTQILGTRESEKWID